MDTYKFDVGDLVYKFKGGYRARGRIVARFLTSCGAIRYVFEFNHPVGLLHIFDETQLKLVEALP